MRPDFEIIQRWIKPSASVLDLGCGDGSLLALLRDQHGAFGYGLEINPDKIQACIEKKINVIEQDLDEGLGYFDDNSFDTVIMSQALQAVRYPDRAMDNMLRVGKECIIAFPNFGFWRCRLYLLLKGRMPVSESLPYSWYDTPNIHLCTFSDFEAMCHRKRLRILNRTVVDFHYRDGWLARIWPNLFGETAIYHVTRA